MSIFDRFKAAPGITKAAAEMKIDFTEEESAAINASMDEYASIWASTHGGGSYITPVKVHNGMMAKALTEYALDLVAEFDGYESEAEVASFVKKATQAQAKACALHNLPVYVFQLAGIYESVGDHASARKFLDLFLRAHSEFTPDGIDDLFLTLSGFDMPRTLSLAKEKLDASAGGSTGSRFVVIPVTEARREAVAEKLIALSNDVISSHCGDGMTVGEISAAHRSLFECMFYAFVVSIGEVFMYDKYTGEDAQDIMYRAFACFFGEGSGARLESSFQESFNKAHEHYVSIWQMTKPLLNLTEDQMYQEWAKGFASGLAVVHKIPCSRRKVEGWAAQVIDAFRSECYVLDR